MQGATTFFRPIDLQQIPTKLQTEQHDQTRNANAVNLLGTKATEPATTASASLFGKRGQKRIAPHLCRPMPGSEAASGRYLVTGQTCIRQ